MGNNSYFNLSTENKAIILMLLIFFLTLIFIIIPIINKREKLEEERKYKSTFNGIVAGKYEYRGYHLIIDTTSIGKYSLSLFGMDIEEYKSIKIGDTLLKIQNSNSFKVYTSNQTIFSSFYKYTEPPQGIKIYTTDTIDQ